MFQAQGKTLIIVHDSKTKQCASFLEGLIGEKSDARVPINAINHDSKTFAALPAENKSAKQKILYIGNFPESDIAINNVTKFHFDKFGIRYGWHGRKAVIYFDTKQLSPEEFVEMAAFAEKEFKEYDMNMRDSAPKEKQQKKWSDAGKAAVGLGGLLFQPLLAPYLIAKAFAGIYGKIVNIAIATSDVFTVAAKNNLKDIVQIREHQMKFAVLHFSLFGLPDFMGIKDNEEE